MDVDDYTQISLLPGGQKVLEFTPNHSGYYYFDTNGTQNTELEISGLSITEIQVLRNTNKKIKAHLKAGVTYKIIASYEDDEYAGIFFLNIYNESLDMGNSNVTIHSNSYGGDIYKFEPSKTSSYEFSTSNLNIYFAILDEDYNQIFGNNTNNLQAFLSSGSIYYLLVKNKTSSHYTTNISFTEVTSLQLNTNTIVASNGNEKYMRFKPNSSGYYSMLIDNYGGYIEYNVLNSNYSVSNASGAIVLDLYIEANQEIVIRIRTSNSLRINISNSQSSYKWEVNGVIQTNNYILLNRGTTTTIRLKFGDYYITNIYPIPSDANSYSFANNKLTIYSNGVIDERIVLHAINDNSPIYLFVYIGHTFSDGPFDIYNGEDFYGLRWNYVSGINSADLSLVINIQGTNYEYPIIYGFNASSENIDLNSFVSMRGGSVAQDVKVTLKWMKINGVTIYNTSWIGYSGLTTTQKRQNVSVLEKTVNNYFSGGTGTSSNPYTLSNFRHLYNIRYLTTTSNKYIKMTNNIYVPNVNDYNRYDIYWDMISTPFYGVFDGNGYSIHKINLVYTSTINSNKTNFGLFEINQGTIKNLTIKESGASSKSSRINSPNTIYVGMIAGKNYGEIINCHYDVSEYQGYTISMAIFNKNQFIGGLVGYNNGVIRNSTFNGTLLSHGNVGGIVGFNDYNGIVDENQAYGEVNVRYNNDMLDEPIHYSGGGIASVNYGTIKTNVNYANIEFYCANYFESRILQPRIGQIIGTNYGVQQNNNSSGVIYKWDLKTVTWQSGKWPFRKTHYHYQDLYVGGAVGYQT